MFMLRVLPNATIACLCFACVLSYAAHKPKQPAYK